AALVYVGGALGVVFAGDWLTLFLFWELKAVASAGVIWAGRAPGSAPAGRRYLYAHLVGGTLLLAGIAWRLSATGELGFTALSLGEPGAWPILVGVLLSAAVPPLHAWLPDAYPRASVAGTVFLSAFTTKAAVYTLARGFPGVDLLVWLGVIMALYGTVYAVLANDIRRLLAYSIVSQVGYMVVAVGLGTDAAINGATAHAFAHILYKALLLMGAGAVVYATGRGKLGELGGLARAMPAVVGLYVVGALSIAGVPLFSGFVTKELTLHAAELAKQTVVVDLLKVASVGTFIHTGLKLPYLAWFALAPAAFYGLLPHPVEYTPYTTSHVIQSLQLLVPAALVFWLLAPRLAGWSASTLDVDWTYRVLPGRLVAAARAVGGHAPGSGVVPALDRIGQAGSALGGRLAREAGAGQHAAPRLMPTWLWGAVALVVFVGLLTLGLLR
ncbi:MAG: Na(+)/H(+) antiporter subunit D, partial [Actinobacteria bacterium QS_5_72_10]